MLTPEEIQSREFLVSLRGYDRDEVHAFLGRVAEQLAQTEAKAAQLQQRIERLKVQQPAAAGTVEAAPAPSAASPEPSAMFAEIGKETQRILEAAQEAGQQIQRKARQEADRDLQSARSQAAKLIAEGERRREHIERIVSELEQSRAAMSVQLRGIGRTIDQTLRELGPSEASATVREAIGGQAKSAAPSETVPEGNGGLSSEKAQEAVDAPPAVAAEAEDAAAEAVAEPAPAPPEPEPEPAAEAAPAEKAASGQQELPDTGTDSAPTDDGAAGSEAATAAPEAEAEAVEAEAAPEAPPESATEAPAAALVGEQAAEAEPVATAPVATEPAMPSTAQAAAGAGATSDPQGMRAAALSPLHPKLVRKVKRELQEIQNIALDKVRRAKGQGDVDSFLPADEDTSGLGEGAADLLEQAWRAGVASAGVLAERDIETPDDIPDLAGGFLNDAADRVRSGLSATLKMGLSAGDNPQGLSDRIGSVFSEFKGAQSEELAATHLIKAYEYGLLGAWRTAGVSARTWVMGREPRCPEAKCRANDQGGPVPVGEAFGSGHDVPPVHVGCTCTTIPAAESSA